MPEKQEQERDKELKQQQAAIRNERIVKQVMDTIGPAIDLREVRVRRLWADRYRVNVFLGTDVTNSRIAHSYFVQADAEGNILDSNPKMVR